MKLIRVDNCLTCPNCEFNSPECGNDNYYCNELPRTLAKESSIMIRGAVIHPITHQVTSPVVKWMFTADGKTEWTGIIPEDCPLEEAGDPV